VEGSNEDKASWLNFFRLKQRGLKETQLFISDKCLGFVEALGDVFPVGMVLIQNLHQKFR